MQNNKDSKDTKANERIDNSKKRNPKLHNQNLFKVACRVRVAYLKE